MNVPYWLLKLLPMWEYICPACRKEVKQNSHRCPHCGEHFPLAIQVPSSLLKDSKKLEAYVHQHIFPRVSEFERNYLTKYFTTIFSDGFETGLFDLWTDIIGTPTVQDVIKHTGLYAAFFDGSTDLIYKTFAAQAICYARGYFYFDTLPGAGNNLYIMALDDGSGYEESVNVRLDSNQFILRVIEGGVGTNYATGITAIADAWYCVEVKRDVTNDLTSVFINSVETTGNQAISSNSARLYVGVYTSSGTPAFDFYSDCVVVADAYIGPEAAAGGSIPVIMHHRRTQGMS